MNLLLRKSTIAACASLMTLSSASAVRAQAPDTIFFHGNILTGTRLKAGDSSPTPGRVSAVAIRAGTIVAVGSDTEILALKGEHTVTVDLNGAFAMPGFNDAHTHIASAGQQRLALDLDNVPSLAAMLAKVRAYAATLAPGAWILGGGWDHTKWAVATLPTRADLDAVTGDHPAFLDRTDGHIAIANSAVLAAAKITDATPNPEGGKIDRDADGHATGIIREGPALALVEQHIPPPSYEAPQGPRAIDTRCAVARSYVDTGLFRLERLAGPGRVGADRQTTAAGLGVDRLQFTRGRAGRAAGEP